MADDDLIHLEGAVGADGVSGKLTVNERFATMIAKLLPGMAGRLGAKRVITARVLEKLGRGELLDEAETEYAETVLGEAEAKFARRKAVAARAVRALEAGIVGQLPPHEGETAESNASEPPKSLEEDWLNRFWADAELVSDETVQEIYGRILAGEAVNPGSCSRRTLAVMRGLDRQTAETFGKVLSIVLGGFVPNETGVLAAAGLRYPDILDLGDAGLVDSGGTLSVTIPNEGAAYTWGQRAVFIGRAPGLQLRIFPLTRAGRDLARIAEVSYADDYFQQIIEWLKRVSKKCLLAWAQLPHKNWSGDARSLAWHDLTPERNDHE